MSPFFVGTSILTAYIPPKKLHGVMGRIFDVIAIASMRRGVKDVFELAVEEGLTIYDAM
jgi:hypothetical protein